MASEKLLMKIGEVVRARAVQILSREAFDKGILASSLNVDVQLKDGSVTIGTNLQQGLYVEYGTGQRGSEGFKSYFGEPKPSYTIPILPKEGSVLAWVTKGHERPTTKEGWKVAKEGGYARFAKSTKGMKPIAFMRRALFESKQDIVKVIKQDIKMNPSEWLDVNN